MSRTVVRVGTARAQDGALLSFRVDGEGALPPILCSNGLGVSTVFFWKLAGHFAPSRPVITWDYRGHGSSPVPARPGDITVAQCARDLWTVADAAEAPQAILAGHSMGCQVALEALRLAPNRVRALVPMMGASGRVLRGLPGGEAAAPLWRALLALGEREPRLIERQLRAALGLPGLWQALRALGVVHQDLAVREEFEPWFEHLRGLDLRCWFALARDLIDHDASSLLPQVGVPALVIGGARDRFVPARRSREMAAAIPGAELLIVRGGTHAAPLEQPELIALAVENFLRRHRLS